MTETVPDEILEHMPKSFQLFHEIEQKAIEQMKNNPRPKKTEG